MVDVLHMVVEHFRTAHRGRICVHVESKEHPERHYARQLMKLSKQERTAKFYRHLSPIDREPDCTN